MFFLEIGLVILGAVAVSVILLVLFAVARERKPLTGAALAISAPATAYAHAERRLLRARGLDAERRDFEIGDPAIRVHAFEIPGDGPPVVLIHGGGATAISWLPLLPELHGRHVFVVDRPGCGLTDGFDYSRVDLRGHGSAFIGSVLDALALERPVLVGNSMGGLWALRYALEHPERVAGLAPV